MSDTTASRSLVVCDAVLARVVDPKGVTLFSGLHPRGLPPRHAAVVVKGVRTLLPGRGPVSPEELRDEEIGRITIASWEQAVAALDARPALPERLSNTDGDPFLLTTDHFVVERGASAGVAAALAAIPNVTPPESGEDPPAYVFTKMGNAMHRNWDNTIVGSATLAGQALRVETNSVQRADALRSLIESACGNRIRHRLREHADPLSEKAERGRSRPEAKLPPAEAARLAREFKERHYADWVDTPLPALGGKTPRQAVRSKKGRAKVDLLLREFENAEQRQKPRARFDISTLRRELRLDDADR